MCLTKMEDTPSWLTEMAYEWCSVICENYSSLEDRERLLFLALEVGFRHLNPKASWISAKLTHTEHHRKLVDIVFEGSEDGEAVADLLYAWTSASWSRPYISLEVCAEHLIGLLEPKIPSCGYITDYKSVQSNVPCTRHLKPHYRSIRYPSRRSANPVDLLSSSQRLQQLVICTIGLIGFWEFKRVDVEGFYRLLDHLHVCAKDVEHKEYWARLLLDAIQSPEGIQHVSYPYWELLVELSISESWLLRDVVWSPHIIAPLEASREWDKLECWISVGWMLLGSSGFSVSYPSGVGPTPYPALSIQELEEQMGQWNEGQQEDLKCVTLSLFRQQQGAIQKLEKWMEQWSKIQRKDVPDSFQQICAHGHLGVPQEGVL